MTEDKEEKPIIVPLNKKQKGTVLDNLEKRSATFYTWEQLQNLLRKLRPHTRIADIQTTPKKTSNNPKQ
jgi:hypothetical protein